MTAPATARRDAYASFRIPAFRFFIASLLAMTLGVQIQGVVVAWQVYALTRDPLSLGLVGLAEALPFLAVALPAGQWADRHDRRRLATGAIAVLVACAVALLALTATGALAPRPGGAAPTALVRFVYAVLAVSGVARAMLQPARQALAADLVPIELYPNAVTWRSTTWQAGSVVGPALGGLLFALAGATVAYATRWCWPRSRSTSSPSSSAARRRSSRSSSTRCCASPRSGSAGCARRRRWGRCAWRSRSRTSRRCAARESCSSPSSPSTALRL